MTDNERMDFLEKGQEWSNEMHRKTQIMLADTAVRIADLTGKVADIMDGLKRLERVAGVLLINDEELDRRLTALEGRPPRRPQ